MNKNKIQPKAVQGTAVATGEEKAGKLVIIQKAEPTAQDLQKEVERLKKLLARVPESLEEKILYYQQKEQWIKNLDKLKGQREYLAKALHEVREEMEEDEFLSEVYSIAVSRKKGYSNEESIFKVQNPVLVGDLLQFVLGKVDLKLDELQISIES